MSGEALTHGEMIHSSMFRSLWQYRGFIWSSVVREFSAKYRGSILGVGWALASPLAMITIYTVVFSELMRPSLPGFEQTRYAFSIYLCAGIIGWNLFAEILGRMSGIFLENANLIKKANFPRICLLAIVALSSLLNFLIPLGLFLVFLALIGYWPGLPLISLIPILLLQVLFAIGVGVTLGTLNVFFRDVGQMTSIALQFWFWLTPIVYTERTLPSDVRAYFLCNPMAALVEAYQTIFLSRGWPDAISLVPLAGVTTISLAIGAWMFLGQADELVDEL